MNRALDILELLADEPQGLTVSEISARLGIARSSTHGLVHTLLRRGCVDSDDPGGRRFRLGVRLVQLGLAVVEELDLRSVARGPLERLVARAHETAFVALFDHSELVYLDKVLSPERAFRTDPRMGARRPLHCTSLGKALLAALGDGEALALLEMAGLAPMTRSSITDPAQLLRDLARTRERGYSVDRQEAMIGICCVGAPVRDHTGRPIGAISVSTISDLFDAERLGPAVLGTALEISRALGWSGAPARLYASDGSPGGE